MDTGEHVVMAKKINSIQKLLNDIHRDILIKFPKTSKLGRLNSKLDSTWAKFKSELDTEFHRVTPDKEFKKLGYKHIYYDS